MECELWRLKAQIDKEIACGGVACVVLVSLIRDPGVIFCLFPLFFFVPPPLVSVWCCLLGSVSPAAAWRGAERLFVSVSRFIQVEAALLPWKKCASENRGVIDCCRAQF